MSTFEQVKALESAIAAIDALLINTRARLEKTKLKQDELNKAYLDLSETKGHCCALLDGTDETYVASYGDSRTASTLLLRKLKRAIADTQRYDERAKLLSSSRETYSMMLAQISG